MKRSIAVLLGAVTILAMTGKSHAAIGTQDGFDPAAVQHVQYYHHYHHRHWHRWHHWHRGPVVVINPR